MPDVRKVAFVSPFSTAYVHRLMRGALSCAESLAGLSIRDFRLTRGFNERSEPDPAVRRLQASNPDGLLTLLENAELDSLLRILPKNCPVASMSAVQLRPGVAVVAGSFSAEVEIALNHFRHQGLRSVSLLLLESEEQMQTPMSEIFKAIARPADPARDVFVEVVDPGLLDDSDEPVTPVPNRLAAWMKRIPKPGGIFCPQVGGGGYVIRVCHALGLRVPQDLAVIGADDADLCLASHPTLTSVMPVGEKIGFEAMRILNRMMEGHDAPADRVRLDAMDLHVRGSTGLQRAQVCDIAAAVHHINQYACTGLRVSQLLKATQQVSGKTFHTHFRAATGETPGEAIQARQIGEARRLLVQTGLSVTMVAEMSGFGSSSDFARRFRAINGISPTEFRFKAGDR